MTMSHSGAEEPKAITGKTVLAWLLGFFGVVFTVNGVFLYMALGSFPGVAVESSYKAGQAYNQDIAASQAQVARGWTVETLVRRSGENAAEIFVTALDQDGTPLTGLQFSADLRHPTYEGFDRTAQLVETGPGQYRGTVADVNDGNWNLALNAVSGSDRVFRSQNRVFLAQ